MPAPRIHRGGHLTAPVKQAGFAPAQRPAAPPAGGDLYALAADVAAVASGAVLLHHAIGWPVVVGAYASYAATDSAPSADVVFTISLDGETIGTLTVAAGEEDGTFDLPARAASPGQRLKVVAPATLHGLTDLTITLACRMRTSAEG